MTEPSYFDRLQALAENQFFIGLLAGVVSLRGVPGTTWIERAFNVMCACLTAGYIAPWFSELFGLDTVASKSAMAFVVGLFGLNVVASFMEQARALKISDFLPWFGKKG